MERQIVNMQDHFDVDEQMEELAKRRFAMPPAAIAAFRQAAAVGVQRLLDLVSNEDVFNKMKPQDQVKILELIFDRAYGKSETASTSMVAEAKVGHVESNDHASQLDAIAARQQRQIERERQGLIAQHNEQRNDRGAASTERGGIAASPFPELNRARRAAQQNVVAMPRRPAI